MMLKKNGNLWSQKMHEQAMETLRLYRTLGPLFLIAAKSYHTCAKRLAMK